MHNGTIDDHQYAAFFKMNTPLLVSDEVPPSLSGGGTDPDANSQLTLMLREASSPPSNATLLRNDLAQSLRRTTRRQRAELATVSFVTMLAGSMIMIQIGLLWGSFLSTSWLQVHVVATQISWLTPPVNTMLKNLDLGEMVNIFVQTKQTAAVAVLAMTTILVPCLTMITQPLTILERHSAVLLNQDYEAKSMVNFWIRFGFLAVFCVIILDICISHVQINWIDSQVMVQNRIGPGLLSYSVGLSIAMAVAMVLRLAYVKVIAEPTPTVVEAVEEGYMRVLEEEEDNEDASPNEDTNVGEVAEQRQPQPTSSCYCSYRLMIFECAVLSLIFGVASFLLPLFFVSYEGFAAAFLSDTKVKIGLIDLVQVEQGNSTWTAFFFQIVVVLQVICFPVLAIIIATITAFGTHKRWLGAIHPGINGLTLCAAILIIIPSLEPVGNYVLNEQTSGLCNSSDVATDDSCLTMVGSIGIGTWCFLAHAIFLELFVLLISWQE